MEVYEQINEQLDKQGISKKEFATRLIALEPKLKNTGEVPSEKAIYTYLSGRTALRVELIPHIVDILGITEQELFDDSEAKRVKQLRHILKNPTEFEKKTAMLLLKELDADTDYGFPTDYQLKRFAELLPYAPTLVADKLIQILQKYKGLFDEIKNEGK